MTKAFLEPTILKKENVDLFLKAFTPEAIEKVKKIDEKRKARKKELEKMLNDKPSVDEIMKKFLDE